jgi:hypothetical protein
VTPVEQVAHDFPDCQHKPYGRDPVFRVLPVVTGIPFTATVTADGTGQTNHPLPRRTSRHGKGRACPTTRNHRTRKVLLGN